MDGLGGLETWIQESVAVFYFCPFVADATVTPLGLDAVASLCLAVCGCVLVCGVPGVSPHG